MPPSSPLDVRFQQKVDIPDDMTKCWIWKGGGSGEGYGRIWFGKGHLGAHRASWIIFRGEIPEGKHILHTCNNGAGGCVNPGHLYVGTDKENTQDKVRAGNNGTQKLKVEDVLIIRARLAAGDSQTTLAKQYGVSQATISRVELRQTFSTV
jgi:DNA-binding XRE family transcriptional regulator